MSSLKKQIKRLKKRQKAYRKLMKRKRISKVIKSGVSHRHRAEKRFKLYGIVAVIISLFFLVILLSTIIGNGYSAFLQTQINIPVKFSEASIKSGNYRGMVNRALRTEFPDIKKRKFRRNLYSLISKGAPSQLADIVEKNPDIAGKTVDVWLIASSDVDMFFKGKIPENVPEESRNISDHKISLIKHFQNQDRVRKAFNTTFFTSGDSREPELAGVLGSVVGSIFVIISCMFVAFPLGVLTAVYLEEFAPKNKLTDIIEININNLAAVPSIVFGLLGLAIYIQMMGIPRSAALAGGLTLALMALPVIVISTRTSIKAIPQSIRDGAMALGASKVQTTMHHVVPLAMPGIMTGTILSVARVLGETAPLLMIGMVAFIVDIPSDFLDAATAVPVQVYLWSDSPEMGFIEKTSAAIIVLLIFLIAANALAVYLRKKFEVRW